MEDESLKKKVDEDWKKEVRLEKQKEKTETKKERPQMQPPEANFLLFASSLVREAMIHLGAVENPLTKKTETNLDQARYIIDTLVILQEKTKGNLTGEEKKFLDTMLDELKIQFATKAG